MNILAIGAHADDVELGCGGALLKWRTSGHRITVFTATNSGFSAPDGTAIRSAEEAAAEAGEAAAQLGARLITGPFDTFGLAFGEALNAALIPVIQEVMPDLVLTHWTEDTHPDHKALALATLHACRRVPSLLMYISNWYPSTQSFHGTFFVDITETFEGKLDLLRSFRSETSRTGDAWFDFVRDNAATCGRACGVPLAESFQVVKYLHS